MWFLSKYPSSSVPQKMALLTPAPRQVPSSPEPEGAASTTMTPHHTISVLTTPQALVVAGDPVTLSVPALLVAQELMLSVPTDRITSRIATVLGTVTVLGTFEGSSFRDAHISAGLSNSELIAGTIWNGAFVVNGRRVVVFQIRDPVLNLPSSQPLSLPLLQTFSPLHGSCDRSTIKWLARRSFGEYTCPVAFL